MKVVVDELKAMREQLRRRAPHRDHRRERRVPDRGPDRRRGHGDHGHRHRLHQADADHHLPDAAPRRQGPHRHAHARRGLRQPPLHRLDARLHPDLHGPRPRLLAEGPRDPRRRSRRQGQGHRQPRLDGGGREDRRAPHGAGVAGRGRAAVHRDGHAQGRHQEDRPVRVQQPARGRHHRDGRRGGRRGDRGRALRRQGADLPRHPRRHGHPLRRDRRAADGPRRLRRARHHRSATTTKWSRWKWCAKAARC